MQQQGKMDCKRSLAGCTSRSTSEKKSICIRAQEEGKSDRKKIWYCLNLFSSDDNGKENEKKKKKISNYSKIPESPTKVTPIWETKDVPGDSCLAAMGSMLYSMGGDPRKSYRFRHFMRFGDLSYPENGWKDGLSMMNDRSNAHALSMNGKIYIFGGRKEEKRGPWAEVFDPVKNRWKILVEEPPFYFYSSHMFVLGVEEKEKKIVFCSMSHKGLHIYDICDHSWVTLDETFSLFPYRTNPVIIGSIMYWLGNEFIHAYDLETKRRFSGPIKCPVLQKVVGERLIQVSYLPFIHLGGDDFCVIWMDRPVGYSQFICVKLKVSKQVDHVKAVELFVKAFPVDAHLTYFDAWPVDLMQQEKEEDTLGEEVHPQQ